MGKKATMKGSGGTFSSQGKPPKKNQVVPLTESAAAKAAEAGSCPIPTTTESELNLEICYYYMYRTIHEKFINYLKKDNQIDLKEKLYKPIALLHDYMLFSKNINTNILSKNANDKIQMIENTIKSKGTESITYNFNANTFLYYVLNYYNNIKEHNISLSTTVYHGTNRFANSDLKVGNTITMKTFLSTSLYREVAELFAQKVTTPPTTPIIFIITLQNSKNYINVGNIEQQYEILLPIGSELFITETKIKIVLDKKIKEVYCTFNKYNDAKIQTLLNTLTRNTSYNGMICDHNHIAYEDVGDFSLTNTNDDYVEWIRKYQTWLNDNIREHIKPQITTRSPGPLGESSTSSTPPEKRKTLKQRIDDDDDIGLYANMIDISTVKSGAGSGKTYIGKKQFQCTPTNKVKIPLSTAYKLHISLGFKNDTRLLGKERSIYGNKRQYIMITPNEAKKLHQRALKRQ